jgi:branched-chain amino acid transport system permease protein
MATQALAASPSRLGASLKDAALAAFVALALAVPLVGFQTSDQSGAAAGLQITYRFDMVAIGVAVVFFGRLALTLWTQARPATFKWPSPTALFGAPAMARARDGLGPALVAVAAIMPFTPFADRFIVDMGVTILIYVMLGWGLNVVVGLAGLLDLGYVAFYAVGAYSFALLTQHFGLSFWECLPLAGLFAAAFGVLLGFPVLRLRGDYLAIVTLGFGEMIRIILLNWQAFTGGPNGLHGIPRPSFFNMPFTASPPEGVTAFHEFMGIEFSTLHRLIFLYYVIFGLALLTNYVTLRLRRLPIGRAWEALREDEIACRALGINPTNTKLTAFGIGAMFGGFAGSFFATRQGFISPESFTFIESATILAIVVLGGMGSQIGVALAAAVLVMLPEFGREFAQFRMLVFGAAMIAIMVWRPGGLLASRDPTIRLHPSKPGGTTRP